MFSMPAAGAVVPVSFSAGYIVLSYLVSYVGCLTALELLLRRTHHGGLYNWFLLGGAATAMGGVAIWAMHFIGMQAMIMAEGETELQLYYYASYTAGSFFLPIAIVSLAFSVFSSSERASVWRIAVAGTVCGAAICGMHYVGQVGIVSYDSEWNWKLVLASVVIAMSAATIALGVFFYLSSKWINALWKRALCAILLAGAVCLMHWTAVLGTTFHWKGLDSSLPPGLTKTGAVWVCGALALSCCFVLTALAIILQYVRRRYAQKAQQISLALAYFAPDGGIMLNIGGHMPMNRITKNYLSYSAKDTFGVDTAPFAWMYRASRNWSCIKDLVTSMRLHIQRENGADTASINSAKGSRPFSYATVLTELFCIAAEDLAHLVDLPITQVGGLYDRILDTGRITPHVRMFGGASNTITTESDFESGPRLRTTLTRGQVMFLVRHLEPHDVTHLQTIGYSFAPPRTVINSIAGSMQISAEELRPYLNDLASYKGMPNMLDAGAHVASFVVKPVVGSWEVLGKKSIRNQMPSVALPLKKLEQWQILLLKQYDGWEASALLLYWTSESTKKGLTKVQQEFTGLICDAMIQLRDRIGVQLWDKSRLVAKVLIEPGLARDAETSGIATIIAFKCVTDIHYTHPATARDVFVNALLFTTQQHCYPDSPDHAVFAGRVHTDFASMNRMNGIEEKIYDRSSHPNSLMRRFSFHGRRRSSNKKDKGMVEHQHQLSDMSITDNAIKSISITTDEIYRNSEEQAVNDFETSDDISEKYLVPTRTRTDSGPEQDTNSIKPRSYFGGAGGVHVSNEIHISVADADATSLGMLEMDRMGMRTEIGAVRDRESAVDILMAMALGGLRG